MSINIKDAENFEFSPENMQWTKSQLAKYPENRKASCVMPFLHRAQEQNHGWVSVPVMEYIADFLDMPYIRVHEVASFYSMYNLKPVGKHVIEVCTTTPCWLKGSDDVVKACKEELGIGFGETTRDGEYTLLEVECAGACVNAPVIAYKEEYYEDLDDNSTRKFIKDLKSGATLKPGPQNGRFKSCPMGGPTSLKDKAPIGATFGGDK
ncbi:MAG: NADH-quinone oxidoreductase subunit NuoE [Kordiimonadaceae bacterium]|jgi:NADH-quinone oxidoreductase E subunit|nr:NADH-quinone oxidoreductase subunit NuoE [Kordiimonadaceae bacterium]MBT6037167.1 NADH-quinone oxidoreductase subunit NuoE [Kordiimonadaceae bacterium]MBT6330190.1 NADH-quinone oxidoreductase subunit NuoE [Kordiimonadaceae bacterium]